MRISVSVSVSALLVLAACSEPPPSPVTDGGTPPPEEISWSDCPLHTEGNGPDAQCATLKTPLDASRPDGETIDFFVKRWRPPGGQGKKALIMLQGGPGASGYVFEQLSEQFATRFPDVDYYMPDHRGTGRSTRLGCPEQESETSEGGLFITDDEWPACLAAVKASDGDRLAAFNTTNAANDVGILVRELQKLGKPVFIYGVSYGTYWAQRYLQLYPEQADGVIFDSIAPQGISLMRQDEDANEAAHDFLNACSADSVCGGKLGPDAWGLAEQLFTKLNDGYCSDIAVPDAPTHVILRRAFGGMLMDPVMRVYIPAIIRRADRCEPRDVDALKVLMKVLTREQPYSEEYRLWGWILSQNIIHSEMSETPKLTLEQLDAIREGAVASRDVTRSLGAQQADWPTYTPDAYASTWASTTRPVLMLQGGLDPATLLRKGRLMKPHFTGPHQTWVEFPNATHTTIASSPFKDEIGDNRSCGTRLLMAFMDHPTETLDTSCVEKVHPLDFTLTRFDYNQALFGTFSAWE